MSLLLIMIWLASMHNVLIQSQGMETYENKLEPKV